MHKTVRTAHPTRASRLNGLLHQCLNLELIRRARQTPIGLVREDLLEFLRTKMIVQNLDMFARDQSRMRDTAGVAETQDFFAKGQDVIRQSSTFIGRIEAAHQPGVLGGNTGWTAVRVAFLRLNTANRQHRFPGDVDHVATERKSKNRFFGKAKFATADEDDVFVQASPSENSVNSSEAQFER